MGIVVLSIVGIILEEMESGFININPTIIRVMRVLRIARGKQLFYTHDAATSPSCIVIVTGHLQLLMSNFSNNP